MARYRMSDTEMLKGVKKALASPRVPSQLVPGLRRLRDRLEARIEAGKKPQRQKDFLSGFLGI